MSRAEDPLARAERITAELRAATAEAAGVVKDLDRAMKLAREQVNEYYAVKVKGALDAHTMQWDRELTQRLRHMVEDVNRVAGRARDRAEAAIDTATTIQGMAERLAEMIAKNTRRTPDGAYVHYGDLTDPDTIELN